MPQIFGKTSVRRICWYNNHTSLVGYALPFHFKRITFGPVDPVSPSSPAIPFIP